MKLRKRKERVVSTETSIAAYQDFLTVAEEIFHAETTKMSGGLKYIKWEVKTGDIVLYLMADLVDPGYGIRLVSKTYFWFNESKMGDMDKLMEDLIREVQKYWNEGKGKLNELKNRPVMDAELRPDGWVQCPYCQIHFATYSNGSWEGDIHRSCGTELKLIPK
jgi:hypothetical protein